jgi:hypothetical protein
MTGKSLRGLTTALLLLLTTAIATAAEPPPWPDSFVGRLEALALIESLNADLLAHDSATLTIERWCGDHRLADPPRLVAERVRDADKPPSAEVRAALDVKQTSRLAIGGFGSGVAIMCFPRPTIGTSQRVSHLR